MSVIEMIIGARKGDIGNFTVARVLPYMKRRMLGPFIFLDQMGPAHFAAGEGLDVLPHPHIGLSTVTYLYEGVITHRDSLGSLQNIEPGDVNWMTAGSGIVHSERTPPEIRTHSSRLYGIQMWVALPQEQEDIQPSFVHIPKQQLPSWQQNNIHFRLIAGEAFGRTSPAHTFSSMFYVDIQSQETESFKILSSDVEGERGLYLVEGAIEIENQKIEAQHLVVFEDNTDLSFTLEKGTKCLLLGGVPFPEKKFIYWNFVSSSRDKIENAKQRWKGQTFTPVPNETGFVPLPS